MKRKLLLICVAFFAWIYGLSGAWAYSNTNYNASYYNNNYGNQYYSSNNCNSYSTQYVCGIDGNTTKTFTNTCYLSRDSRYDYAYSGRCTSSKTRDFKYNRDYYDNNYGVNYYRSNTYSNSYNNNYKTNNSNHDNINYSYNDRVNYNTTTYSPSNTYYSGNNTYNRYNNNYSPNYQLHTSYINNDSSVCPTYNMRQLVPACHYKYASDSRGCTRPVIHCAGNVRDKFVDTRSYSFTSYGIPKNQQSCPVFKLSVAVNGCSYEYIKNEDGCDVPRLVCGTQNTSLSWALKVKADNELTKKYNEIDNNFLNKQSKIIALQALSSKLEAELRSNTTDAVLLKYMIASVAERIEAYELSNGVTPIFDLLD